MGNFAENMLCDKSSSHGVTETKRQQLRRVEVLARNRLAVKQPIQHQKAVTRKSNSASQVNQMNLVTSIIRGEVASERLGARNEEKETFWQRTVKRKNVIRVRLLL